MLLLLLMASLCALAQNTEVRAAFDSANAAYAKNDFDKAIKGYENILAKGKASAALYFNLGNAYYKTNNVGMAVLNYERAKKLAPDDEDLAANLKLTLQRTEDRIDKAPELFLNEWKNDITGLTGEKNWSLLCIAMLCLSLALFALYIVSNRSGLRKTGFFGGSILLVITVVFFLIARHSYEMTVNSAEAVITAGSVTVHGSPDEKGTKLFILHEGTKVNVQQENEGWTEVRIANGNVGWIKINALQKI
jgi:tetratricopeptide (TPR) repeat protein